MSVTGIRNLTPKEFLLHKHVLSPLGDLTLPDSEIQSDWEILRPLNWAIAGGDVTTSGAIVFPDWTNYPGGAADQSARSVNPVAVGGSRFIAFR